MRRTQKSLGIIAVAAIAAAVGGLSSAYASHQFDDVPTGTFFHDSVAAIVDAGCATGFTTDDTFRTGDNATRGQFSFWVRNCGGRAAVGADPGSATISDPADPGFGPEATLATVDLEVGGATGSGQQQFVTLVGTATLVADGSLGSYCTTPVVPDICGALLVIREGASALDAQALRLVTDNAGGNVTVAATVPASNGSHTYTLTAFSIGAQDVAVVGGRLHATTSMFGPTGANTLGEPEGTSAESGSVVDDMVRDLIGAR